MIAPQTEATGAVKSGSSSSGANAGSASGSASDAFNALSSGVVESRTGEYPTQEGIRTLILAVERDQDRSPE